MLYRGVIFIDTNTDGFYDVTEKVAKVIEESRIQNGICNIFVKSTTAALLLNENDRMLVEDFRKMLESIAPKKAFYQHPENAHSHLHASLMGNNVNVPIADNKLLMGHWQNILLFEFDVTDREREVVVTVHGQ